MKIYDMLINRALNGGSGGGGGGESSDAYTATVTFAVQGSDWIGAKFYAGYALEHLNGYVSLEANGPFMILSAAPTQTMKLPLLKDVSNHWFIREVVFYAPDGETQLEGTLHFTGDIRYNEEIFGDCTITLNVSEVVE